MGSRDESSSSNLDRVKQCESIRVDDMGPQCQGGRGREQLSQSARQQSYARTLGNKDARLAALRTQMERS